MDSSPAAQPQTPPKWQAVGAIARRVLGVLVEKAKTTPDIYPLSLVALTTGCNQKNNRDPQSTYTNDQVEEALEKLRDIGAVTEVQGSGRVTKYRHCMYEWLGVDKVELAVMTELFLRGPQTVGELRGRAARMEPIADLAALRPIVQSLIAKRLVIPLSPEGRGQVVTHALFKDHELAEQRQQVGSYASAADSATDMESPPRPAPITPRPAPAPVAASAASHGVTLDMFNELQLELTVLRADVARLRQEVRDLKEAVGG